MKTKRILLSALFLGAGIFAFNGCSDDDEDNSLPPIGGFNNSNEVGQADRVAYWPLNGTGTESMTGTVSNGDAGVSWVAGQKGQAVSFNNGFLKYPSIPALNNMTSFSVSAWFKVSNNSQPVVGGAPTVFFTMSRPGETSGSINFMSETGWYTPEKDTLVVKGWLQSANELGSQDTRNSPRPTPEDIINGHIGNANRVAGTWAHGVLTWDNTSRMFRVYVNGAKISNPAWELRDTDATPDFLMATPTNPVLGAFATFANGTAVEPWDKGMTGQLDEVRVWKRALTQAEIGALYQLELNQR